MTNILIKFIAFLTSIYTYSVQTLDGGTVHLSQHAGKKILLVNIASNSSYATQMTGLQQLHQQHGDSLLIIAFPTNSFGNEPKDSTALAAWLYDSLHITFPVAKPCLVTGENKHLLYNWLGDVNKNGIAAVTVKKDFQKFLISRNGHLTGIFNSEATPANTGLQAAIQSPY